MFAQERMNITSLKYRNNWITLHRCHASVPCKEIPFHRLLVIYFNVFHAQTY
jgi:hypothetical protein